MKDKIKVGLLGAGYIVDYHARALAAIADVSLHAVCDQSRFRREQVAKKYAIPHALGSSPELAASDCDAVHILLPPALHLGAAFEMVEAGKSVFLEKPMGLSSAECAALCDRAAAKGVAVGVSHNFLFSKSYEDLRRSVKSGELGRIDHLTVSWHFGLPILQFGPYDSWMLSAPANLMFELGSHLAAFIVDLIGLPEVSAASVCDALELPGAQKVYRKWTAVGHTATATALLSVSATAGHADRIVRVRGRGGSAQLDFARDIGWREFTATDNPIFDSYRTAEGMGRTLSRRARRDRNRRVMAALAKRPDADPFDESIFRSIQAYYADGLRSIDPRLDGRFGTQVIRLCEAITTAAGVGQPSRDSISVPLPKAAKRPSVLVVGGTGFIGRRLVARLVDLGYGVRVLTRNARAAAFELGDLPVELVAGSHGDPDCASRAMDGIKTVYHLTKCAGKRWHDYVIGDIEPTRVLAEAAMAAGVTRFIYTGTIASYASDRPREAITNDTPLDRAIARRGLYARSKAACEGLLQRMHRSQGLPLVITRPGIVIGVGAPPWHPGVGRFLSETRLQYWGEGRNFLPLVLVDDVAEALVRAMEVPKIEGQSFLVTSPPMLTARDYVSALSSQMGARIDASPRAAWRNWLKDLVKELAKNAVRHPNRRWPTLHDWRCNAHSSPYDARMTQQVLDWHPVTDKEVLIRRGITEAADWYLR